MSWVDDCEDVGGYLADQDFYAEECEDYDGDCKRCSYRLSCDSSDVNLSRRKHWHQTHDRGW